MIRQLATGRQILLGVLCFLLIFTPYKTFDEVDARLFLGSEVLILSLGLFLLKDYRKYLITTFLMLCIFLMLGEVGFRLHYIGMKGLNLKKYCPADYRHPLSNFNYDPGTYTKRKPHSQTTFKSGIVTINDRGFRGASLPLEKPDQTYRIILVGASTSMGAGVNDDEIFSALLENNLNSSGLDQHIEIINLSIAANTSDHMVHILKHVGLSYEPDLIMVLGNESRMAKKPFQMKAPEMPHYTGSRSQLFFNPQFNFFSSRLFLAQLIKEARDGKLEVPSIFTSRRASSRSDSGLSEAETEPPYDCTAEDTPAVLGTLNALKETVGKIPVILYLLRPVDTPDAQHTSQAYRRMLKDECNARGFSVIDTYTNRIEGYSPRDLLIYPGDKHPNALCHEIYAKELLPELLDIIKGTDQL